MYDAAGNKLKKITTEGSKVTTTLYLGNAVYVNDTLQFFGTPEGRARVVNNNFVYDYFLKDHLGNTRVVITDDYNVASPILESSSYYPFGLQMKGIGLTQENKLHNWKNTFQKQEFNQDLGVDIYEFKYRMDDPQIGRFWQVDPLADDYEYNSTYAFSEDKVTSHIELEGLEAVSVTKGIVIGGTAGGIMAAGLAAGGTVALVGTGTVVGAPVGVIVGGGIIIGAAIGAGVTWLWNEAANRRSSTSVFTSPQPADIKPQTVVQSKATKGPKDLVGDAKAQQAKEQQAKNRLQQRQQQSREGKSKEGKSNKDLPGDHNKTGGGNKGDKHPKGQARRAKDQKVKGPDDTK